MLPAEVDVARFIFAVVMELEKELRDQGRAFCWWPTSKKKFRRRDQILEQNAEAGLRIVSHHTDTGVVIILTTPVVKRCRTAERSRGDAQSHRGPQKQMAVVGEGFGNGFVCGRADFGDGFLRGAAEGADGARGEKVFGKRCE